MRRSGVRRCGGVVHVAKGVCRSEVEGGFAAEAKIDKVLLIPNYRCSLLLSCRVVAYASTQCTAIRWNGAGVTFLIIYFLTKFHPSHSTHPLSLKSTFYGGFF